MASSYPWVNSLIWNPSVSWDSVVGLDAGCCLVDKGRKRLMVKEACPANETGQYEGLFISLFFTFFINGIIYRMLNVSGVRTSCVMLGTNLECLLVRRELSIRI